MCPRVGPLGPPWASGSISRFTVQKVIFWALALSDSGGLGVHVRKNCCYIVASMGCLKEKIKFQKFHIKNGLAVTKLLHAQKKTPYYFKNFVTYKDK